MKYVVLDELPAKIDGRGRPAAHTVIQEFIEVCRQNPGKWVAFPEARRWPGQEVTQDMRRSARASLRSGGLEVRQRNNTLFARLGGSA